MIPIGSDHTGRDLLTAIRTELSRLGLDSVHLGTFTAGPSDYADVAHLLAQRIASSESARGVLICGTGMGMACAANRHVGVRAAVVWSPEIAVLSRTHFDANVLVLPARLIDLHMALECLHAWLTTEFEGGRHVGRIQKIDLLHSP